MKLRRRQQCIAQAWEGGGGEGRQGGGVTAGGSTSSTPTQSCGSVLLAGQVGPRTRHAGRVTHRQVQGTERGGRGENALESGEETREGISEGRGSGP